MKLISGKLYEVIDPDGFHLHKTLSSGKYTIVSKIGMHVMYLEKEDHIWDQDHRGMIKFLLPDGTVGFICATCFGNEPLDGYLREVPAV